MKHLVCPLTFITQVLNPLPVAHSQCPLLVSLHSVKSVETGVSVSGLSVSGLSVSGLSVSGLSVSGLSVSGLSVSGLSVSGLSVTGSSVTTVPVLPIEKQNIFFIGYFLLVIYSRLRKLSSY